MIASLKCQDALVHANYVSHESTPYLLARMERASKAWCLCSREVHGFVTRLAEPLTCLECVSRMAYYGYQWHPMVAG